MQAFDCSLRIIKTLWLTLEVTPVGQVLCPGIDTKGQIRDEPGARGAAEEIGRQLARER